MAFQKKVGFASRVGDHITDELVGVLSGGASFDFKELFLKVHAALKLNKTASGGEEMLRLRCHEKLQRLASRGLVKKTARTYCGLEGIEQATSAYLLAQAKAAVAARTAAVG